jgi:hypothetical protein
MKEYDDWKDVKKSTFLSQFKLIKNFVIFTKVLNLQPL